MFLSCPGSLYLTSASAKLVLWLLSRIVLCDQACAVDVGCDVSQRLLARDPSTTPYVQPVSVLRSHSYHKIHSAFPRWGPAWVCYPCKYVGSCTTGESAWYLIGRYMLCGNLLCPGSRGQLLPVKDLDDAFAHLDAESAEAAAGAVPTLAESNTTQVEKDLLMNFFARPLEEERPPPPAAVEMVVSETARVQLVAPSALLETHDVAQSTVPAACLARALPTDTDVCVVAAAASPLDEPASAPTAPATEILPDASLRSPSPGDDKALLSAPAQPGAALRIDTSGATVYTIRAMPVRVADAPQPTPSPCCCHCCESA